MPKLFRVSTAGCQKDSEGYVVVEFEKEKKAREITPFRSTVSSEKSVPTEITVFGRTMIGSFITIKVPENITIKELSDTFTQKSGFEYHMSFKDVYGNQFPLLDNTYGKRITDFGVGNECTVFLMPRLLPRKK
jgi:hypothetical protein